MKYDFSLLAEADQPQPIVSEPADATETVTTTAEDGSPAVTDPNGGAAPKQAPFGGNMIFIILMFVVIYFFIFRGPKQKQKKHQQMVNELSKNDKVRTIGGIIGTIVDIRDDDIVLKIDETNNTKIKILKGAIATKLKDEAEKA